MINVWRASANGWSTLRRPLCTVVIWHPYAQLIRALVQMTCHLVVGSDLLEDRLDLRAFGHDERAAWVKATTRGWVDRGWDFTRQDDLLALDVWMRRQCSG